MHKSGERGRESNSRSVSRRLLSNLDKWLGHARADRIYEAIDDNDLLENGANSFCGTGYVVLTTFENIRRATDIWIGHKWDYVVMDEGQKVSINSDTFLFLILDDMESLQFSQDPEPRCRSDNCL